MFCRAVEQTHNFSVADVWSGNTLWEGLQNLTLAAAVDILCLPEENNLLSRPLIGGTQLMGEVHSKWWGMLALTFRLRGLLEFQIGCLTVLKKPLQEIAECLSQTEPEVQPLYQRTTREIENAIDRWAQTEISAANEHVTEVEAMKKYYDYGRAL